MMETAFMERLPELADRLSPAAKDIKLNLKTVLKSDTLTEVQSWGVALACAYNEGQDELVTALLADGAAILNEAAVEDAQAAAALMSMNNVYYRFRHMIGKDGYQRLSARLRMTRIAKPATSKVDFELFSLAVSAINGCEMCIRSHESVLVNHGLGEEAIHDAVRIAAVIRAAAVSLRFAVS